MRVILLVNLGSPNKLKISAIRLFLYKFLSDKRVVNWRIRALWYFVLCCFILPIRAKQLLKQYAHIWLNTYSPLIYYTLQQQIGLQSRCTNGVIIAHAFSYSAPAIGDVLHSLHCNNKVDKLTVLPLYPQYSSTTTSAVFDQITKFYTDKRYLPNLNFICDFHDNIHYIAAVAQSITQYFTRYGAPEILIFSYHSLPVKIITSGDKYHEQCHNTSNLIAAKLNLAKEQYTVTFQSKFGGGKWLSPSTATTITDLALMGIKNIALVCPGFISDCLETLEEIAVTNRDRFINNGGVTYHYISCLNDSSLCIDLLYQLVKE